MKRIAYLDGSFLPYEDARIPLDDRALFFGDAVYDACLAEDGHLYMPSEHVERLMTNAARLHIPLAEDRERLLRLLAEAASYIEGTAFLYIQLSRTSPLRVHAYPDTARSRLLLTATETTPPSPCDTVRLISAEDIRYGLCAVKTVNLLPAVLASRDAMEQGADEAVFVKDGYITECAHSNISIVKDGTLITRPTDGTILPGLTRHRTLALCRKRGIPTVLRPFTVAELMEAEDVLVSSSSRLCRRAVSVNGIPVGTASALGERICRMLYDDYRLAVCQ